MPVQPNPAVADNDRGRRQVGQERSCADWGGTTGAKLQARRKTPNLPAEKQHHGVEEPGDTAADELIMKVFCTLTSGRAYVLSVDGHSYIGEG